MYILNLLFNSRGRINRSEWWLGQFLAVVILLSMSIVFHFAIPHHLSFEVLARVFSVHNLSVGALIGITYFWIHFVLNLKRWRDIGKHGAFVVFNYIPILGFFVSLIVLGCVKTKDETSTENE